MMTRVTTRISSRYWFNLAGSLSVTAALIHYAVMPEHFEEWWGYGVTFLVIALAQATFGIALVVRSWLPGTAWMDRIWNRHAPLVYQLGIAGNAAVVILYILTRSIGIPLGPAAGEVEAITTMGLASKVIELTLIGCLVALLHGAEDA